jgi:glycosyltransferase involved in cell wall biosynthesis
MKVLLDHTIPFMLAHGGFQIQIEQTKEALEKVGVEVEYLRWWDSQQSGDVIHFFGRPPSLYVDQAHGKGMKVVVSDLLTALGSRSYLERRVQKALIRTGKALLPKAFTARLAWDSLVLADACVALTPWEGKLLTEIFDVSPSIIHIVPNGVEDVFFRSEPETRDKWLVCTATITERKRVVEAAEAAILADVPLWVIGKPYSDNAEYAVRFRTLQSRHPDLIRYEGPITDRRNLARVYRQARGFVLLSTMESLSLSALEAAACGCPLLLSDLPWARTSFDGHARYCPADARNEKAALVVRSFYDAAPQIPAPPRPQSWAQVAQTLAQLYKSLISKSPSQK